MYNGIILRIAESGVDTMKLAEALLIRAQMQQKLQGLQARILANLRVQEGEPVQEDPAVLLQEAMETSRALAKIIQQINACNVATKLPDGRTLSEALADRDALTRQYSLLAAIANAAMDRNLRMTRTELVTHLTLPIADIQKQMDTLAQQRRELDVQIQSANWTTDMD